MVARFPTRLCINEILAKFMEEISNIHEIWRLDLRGTLEACRQGESVFLLFCTDHHFGPLRCRWLGSRPPHQCRTHVRCAPRIKSKGGPLSSAKRIRFTSNTKNKRLECPRLGVKPTRLTAISTSLFSQRGAIRARDTYVRVPTLAKTRSLGHVRPRLTRSGQSPLARHLEQFKLASGPSRDGRSAP